MSNDGILMTPRTRFQGETPLQTTALAALRSECKYPALFDSAINEMCQTLLAQTETKVIQKAEQDLSASFYETLTGHTVHPMECAVALMKKVIAEKVWFQVVLQRILTEDGKVSLKEIERLSPSTDRSLLYQVRAIANHFEEEKEENDRMKGCLIQILGEALAKKLPDGSEELTVLDAEKPWQDFACDLLQQVKAIKAERDELKAEVEKLRKYLYNAKPVPASLKGLAEEVAKGVEGEIKKRRGRRAG